MADFDEPISEGEKVKIVENFLTNAPPGEFNEVFNDIRVLIADDRFLIEKASGAFAAYDTKQFTPCKVSNADNNVLVTKHGMVSAGRFFDPSSKQQFHYDHLRKTASDVEHHDGNDSVENWRSSVEEAMREYVQSHYPDGNMSVFMTPSDDSQINLITCIEDHQFQPNNFWNGRWRSEWTVTFDPTNPVEPAILKGLLKLQVHYYEDGNVQLVSNKEVS